MTHESTSATIVDPEPASRRGSCLWVTLGIVLILLGIPMLVLPGPGLLAIGAGVALVLRGFGIKVRHK